MQGHLPEKPGEILLTDDFARRLGISPGQIVTLFGSTMYGGMASANFTVAGTIHFGVTAMDRGTVIADIADVQTALDMDDAAGEVLGFKPDLLYRDDDARRLVAAFNKSQGKDDYALEMVTLRDQNGMGQTLDYLNLVLGTIVAIFIFAVSLVLWNAGLLGNLRRYGEIGVRLAIGESQGHLYRSMIAEALMVGVVGTVIGAGVSLTACYYLQAHGINIGAYMKGSSMLMGSIYHPLVTPMAWFIGLIPGLGASFVGAAISGLNLYRRQTSQLLKELEE